MGTLSFPRSGADHLQELSGGEEVRFLGLKRMGYEEMVAAHWSLQGRPCFSGFPQPWLLLAFPH
jgi:hypothetical protein